MRAKNVALTAFLLAPLVVVVILCWLIVLAISRQNDAAMRTPPSPSNQHPAPHG